MPTDLGTTYDASFNGRPEHIAPLDLDIWIRYWPTLRPHISNIYFDVGVGPGVPIPTGTPPNFAKMITRLSQKRIDVLAVISNEIWIIELRRAASPNAIGRVLSYRELYLLDPKLGTNLRLAIVTDERDSEMELVCQRLGIVYLIA